MTKGNKKHLGTRLPTQASTYGRQSPLLEACSEDSPAHFCLGVDCTIPSKGVGPGDDSQLRDSLGSGLEVAAHWTLLSTQEVGGPAGQNIRQNVEVALALGPDKPPLPSWVILGKWLYRSEPWSSLL